MPGQDSIGIFYDVERNLFIDEDGFPIINVFELITPNDLYLFKLGGTYMVVNHRSLPGVLCELFYPADDDLDTDEVDTTISQQVRT